MKFNFFNSQPENKIEQKESLAKLHPDFTESQDGFWYFNRIGERTGYIPTCKVIFKFDDPSLLDKCPFMAKVGKNISSDNYKYFGVAFGDELIVNKLKAWVQKFEWAHYIPELDEEGVMKEGSPEIDLKLK